MVNSSCKNCTERKLGCHSTCELYKRESQLRKEVLANLKAYNNRLTTVESSKTYTAPMFRERTKRQVKQALYR